MTSQLHRLIIATAMVVLFSVLLQSTTANPVPSSDNDESSVADALRFLQDIENRHQFARPRFRSGRDSLGGVTIRELVSLLEKLEKTHSRTPRFGKRGNDYLTKEFPNMSYLRYLFDNPPEATK